MAEDGGDGGLIDRFGHEIPDEEERRKPIHRKRFLVSFTLSLAFAVFVLVVSFSYAQTGAMAVTGIGGFTMNITEIQGDQIQFYSEPFETAACRADYNDTEVLEPNEQAFVGLAADIDSILIPAYSTVNLTKDIDLSSGALGMGSIDGVRIRLFRPDVPDESAVTFPPSADASPDVSVGDVEQSYVDRVELTEGINVRVGSDDGYGDYRFERTTPIVPGESREISVTAHGYNDWRPATATDYPVADAVRRDRHITDVQLQDLSKANTQTSTGYTDYTGFNNTGIGEGQPGFESGRFLRRGSTHSMTVEAVGAAPDFGALDTVRSDADHDVALPSSLSGNLSAQSYIDDVSFQNIGDTGSGDNGGYKAEWSPTSGSLTPGNSYSMTVSGVRRSGTWGDAPELSATASGTQVADYGISDTDMTGVVINANGDQTATTTGLQTVRAGDFITVSACVTTTSSSHKKDLISGDVTEPGVTVGKAFFDWDGDDTAEDDVVIGVHVEPAQDTTSTDCFSTQQQVPNNVTGTGTVRFMTQGAAVDGRDDGDGPDNVPPSSDWGPSGQTDPRDFQGEYIDRTIWIQQRSQVSAFFDWDQNGVFEDEVTVYDDNVTQTGSWSNTLNVQVPDDAVAGSTAMRVIHRNEKAPVDQLVGTSDVNDYIGETQDYTVEVADTRTDSAAYAYFDWDQDGAFDDAQYIDHAPFSSTGVALSGSIDVPTDARAGATLMRVLHTQDGWASGEPAGDGSAAPPSDSRAVNGEWHDYTVHVESEGSFLRAWVDWNNNGTWTPVGDFGIGSVGYGEGNFQNEGGFSRTDQITVPDGGLISQPVHLLRVTHKQDVPAGAGGGPPGPAEGRGGWKGETLDYTIVTDDTIDIFQYENVSLGSVTFKMSELSLEDANLTGDVVLDERYTDDTLQNPQFGPDGQFILSGDDMVIKGVTGRAHLVQFSFFNIPGIRIEVELVDDWNNVDDPVLGGSTSCPPLP